MGYFPNPSPNPHHHNHNNNTNISADQSTVIQPDYGDHIINYVIVPHPHPPSEDFHTFRRLCSLCVLRSSIIQISFTGFFWILFMGHSESSFLVIFRGISILCVKDKKSKHSLVNRKSCHETLFNFSKHAHFNTVKRICLIEY